MDNFLTFLSNKSNIFFDISKLVLPIKISSFFKIILISLFFEYSSKIGIKFLKNSDLAAI